MILESIININFKETFSTRNFKTQALALHSLDTLSFIKSKAFLFLFN